MPERDALNAVHEHPRGEAFVESVEVSPGQSFEQPQRHMRGRYRCGPEQRLRPRREARGARKDSLAYGRGHLGVAGSKRLRCEKGVASRLAIELVHIDSARLGEPNKRV